MYTGDVRGAGTNANVFLVMYGVNGKSDQFILKNKSDNFERGEVDKFKVSNFVIVLSYFLSPRTHSENIDRRFEL